MQIRWGSGTNSDTKQQSETKTFLMLTEQRRPYRSSVTDFIGSCWLDNKIPGNEVRASDYRHH